MGCNCKDGQSIDDMLENNQGKLPIGENIVKYTLKVIFFLLFLILLPFTTLYIVWIAFDMIVLNKNIDIKPILTLINKRFQPVDEEEYLDEEEYSKLTEDDVVMVDVEEITGRSNP